MRHARRSYDPIPTAATLVTWIVLRQKAALLHGRARPVIRGKALPLNPAEPRPLQAALQRNIQALVRSRPMSCCG